MKTTKLKAISVGIIFSMLFTGQMEPAAKILAMSRSAVRTVLAHPKKALAYSAATLAGSAGTYSYCRREQSHQLKQNELTKRVMENAFEPHFVNRSEADRKAATLAMLSGRVVRRRSIIEDSDYGISDEHVHLPAIPKNSKTL